MKTSESERSTLILSYRSDASGLGPPKSVGDEMKETFPLKPIPLPGLHNVAGVRIGGFPWRHPARRYEWNLTRLKGEAENCLSAG